MKIFQNFLSLSLPMNGLFSMFAMSLWSQVSLREPFSQVTCTVTPPLRLKPTLMLSLLCHLKFQPGRGVLAVAGSKSSRFSFSRWSVQHRQLRRRGSHSLPACTFTHPRQRHEGGQNNYLDSTGAKVSTLTVLLDFLEIPVNT